MHYKNKEHRDNHKQQIREWKNELIRLYIESDSWEEFVLKRNVFGHLIARFKFFDPFWRHYVLHDSASYFSYFYEDILEDSSSILCSNSWNICA